MNGVGLGSLGATTLYGGWGQYEDQFAGAGGGVCESFLSPTSGLGNLSNTSLGTYSAPTMVLFRVH